MNYSNTTISSRSDATLVATLDDTTFQIIRYGSIFIFLFGTIGNAFNILVLSQSPFRSSPCAQLFLFASVEPFQKDSPQKCYDATVACRYVTDLLFTFLPILPLIPMLVFGLLTIQNVRQSRNRTIPTDVSRVPTVGVTVNFNPTNRLKRKDHKLATMLLVQIIILCILSIPLGMDKVYSSVMADMQLSELQVAIGSLLYNIAQLLHFLANAVPFYIYTLVGGNSFRKLFFRLMITGSSCYAYVSLPSIDGETNELLKKIFNSFIGGLSSAVDDDDDVDCSLSILLLFDMLLL
ncbi:unnamed protein product [Rotaria socialis]|uniref:G-protein coupled receptors family 1 profile domain-containing protein n=1 Tax=Rotaria socialis TaxID=392032 RepID=A0A818JC51_9BILA|nr:unnamed protein product [Rotaria socialis]CAF4796597.1 unnamed protein product [Rotaria socialis]